MAKQRRGGNGTSRNSDPNQDVQPWLGWIAAMLVVVIVVVAVAMGMERTNNQRNAAAEVRMTPLVGGIEVPVATEPSSAVAVAAEVTPVPEAAASTVTNSTGVTMVTVITTTESATDTFTETGEMTPTVTMTETMTETGGVTSTESMTDEVTSTAEVTATVEVEDSAEATTVPEVTSVPEASAEPVMTEVATEEATVTPEATATVRPTATPRPTATSTRVSQVFAVGRTLTASAGRVELYADAAVDAIVLDSVGPGVELEVLPPSGDFADYPVVVDGIGWVRVRAADGLVGWVQSDLVEAQ